MTIKQAIISVFTISSLICCRQGYEIEDGKVYYEYWNEGNGQQKKLIEQADAKTFQELHLDCDCGFKFGRDNNYLFINGELIKNIDPNTFQFIGNYIFRDKNSAYFFGFYNSLNDCVIKGVNPDKIELIQYPWAKANNILIHGHDTVHIDDINEFVPFDADWGRTKKYIINNNQILYGADVETFKITNSFQGKDKDYNYEFGFINENSFKQVNYKTFNFEEKNICELEPIVFVDIYDELVSNANDKNEKIKIVEELKLKGFTINEVRYLNWVGKSKIVSVSTENDKCNCVVEKLYRYDYSKPSEVENIYKVTERIRCKSKEMASE